MSSRLSLLVFSGAGLAIYALFFASSYDQRILTLSGVYVVLVLGYQFIFGHAGALSLAQGAFFGVGAYTTGILGSQFGIEFLLTFPLSIAITTIVAALISIPILRLQSHYFALATLALSQLLLLIAVSWEPVTGGANGLSGVPPIKLLDWEISRGLPLLAFVWTVVGLAMLLAHWQISAARRAAFTVLRETPLAAAAFGIDASMLRFRAFLLSAAFGGAAGALFVHTNRIVSPETLSFGVMITCLTMTVVGGRFGLVGAVIGALLLTHLPEWFRGLDEYYLVAVGVLLLATVIFAPNGIEGLIPVAKTTRTNRAGTSIGVGEANTTDRTHELIASNLSKRYGGVQALESVSLHLRPGDIVGLIGPNGAGKTTLANVLSGSASSDAGSVMLGGHDITTYPPHKIAQLGLTRTFQTPQLPDNLSVQNIIEIAQAKLPDHDTLAALQQFGLLAYAGMPCGTIAHGVRRRVEICRAVATDPSVLILDEPGAGLSSEEQSEIGMLCKALAETGLAILIIDHNVEFLRPLVTRMVCMVSGRIIADGATAETLANLNVRDAYFGMTAL
jgi:branched-chain amino acid transport system permease protein